MQSLRTERLPLWTGAIVYRALIHHDAKHVHYDFIKHIIAALLTHNALYDPRAMIT